MRFKSLLPSFKVKVIGAITLVFLLLLGCALSVSLASAGEPSLIASPDDSGDLLCGPPITQMELNTLLDQYGTAYLENDHYWTTSDQISRALFCLATSPEYINDLKVIEARAVGSTNPQAYLALSQTLQNDWETRYLLKLTVARRSREQLAAEGSNSMLLVSLALGFTSVSNHVGNYFGLFRQLVPVLIPAAATWTAKTLDTSGLLDNEYPLAPAHVMTSIKMSEKTSDFSAYDVLRTVSGATGSIAGAELATSVISYYSVGVMTLGSFTFNPLTIAASLALAQAGKAAGTKALDEYEFISLKNALVREEEAMLADIANGDFKEAHTQAFEFYKTVVLLASSVDLGEIDAWNEYQKNIAEVNASRHIPLIDETSAAHAKEVYDKKMAKIAAARDPKSEDEVELYTALSLIEDSPIEAAALTSSLSIKAETVLDQYEAYKATVHGNHYKTFIQSQELAQRTRLARAFQNGNISKDSQYVLLQAASFLQIQNAGVLQGTIDDLLHLLKTGLVSQLQ